MAGLLRYTALLDACVLFPLGVCDALMSVGKTELFAPKWTARIDDEWTRSLAAQYSRPVQDFHARREDMHLAYPDWEVPEAAWSPLVAALALPDENDRHVLAAAIAGHADCIVTMNLKDFPASVLGAHGIEAVHPDEFLIHQFELDQVRVLTAFKQMRMRRRNPAFTPQMFADAMERNQLLAVARLLRDAADLI
ncbi:MAG TPA: PIN domain-containing protein [Ideonella sp.]|uniref:PIN domain-containing protein n=1 Tax=Ideonella sp. TaxID=1929293 RepID=UPI002C93D6CB|nr:PIN domain-containing protein [Ideonella sp.]HSI51025.1 PIN domain-containing protein [Ideonella sp.]